MFLKLFIIMFGLSTATGLLDLLQPLLPTWNCTQPSCNQETDTVLQTVRANKCYDNVTFEGLAGYCSTCSLLKLNQFNRDGSACKYKDLLTAKTTIPLKNTQLAISCNCDVLFNAVGIVDEFTQTLTRLLTTGQVCSSLLGPLDLTKLLQLVPKVATCNQALPTTIPNITQQRATINFNLATKGVMSTGLDNNLHFAVTSYNSSNYTVTNVVPEANSYITCLTKLGVLDYTILAALEFSDICSEVDEMLAALKCSN